MPLNTIPNEGLTSRGYPSDRLVTPIIINGDMSVAQRDTSATGKTTTGYYTCDRWNAVISSLGTWTFTQESLSSGNAYNAGFAKSFRMDCTTADATPGSGDLMYIRQKIEAQNLQMLNKGKSTAEKLTLSFWVKSNKTGTNTFTVRLYDHDNTRFVVQNYSISSANTWEHKVINFPADTTGSLNNDNGIGLDVAWYLGGGSDYTGGTQQTTWGAYANANALPSNHVNLADSTDNDFAVTGVQLEVGEFDSTSIPSFPFESHENN